MATSKLESLAAMTNAFDEGLVWMQAFNNPASEDLTKCVKRALHMPDPNGRLKTGARAKRDCSQVTGYDSLSKEFDLIWEKTETRNPSDAAFAEVTLEDCGGDGSEGDGVDVPEVTAKSHEDVAEHATGKVGFDDERPPDLNKASTAYRIRQKLCKINEEDQSCVLGQANAHFQEHSRLLVLPEEGAEFGWELEASGMAMDMAESNQTVIFTTAEQMTAKRPIGQNIESPRPRRTGI